MKEVKHVTYTLTKSNFIAKGDKISEYGQQIVCCPGTDELIAQETDDFGVTKIFRTPEEEYYFTSTNPMIERTLHGSHYITDDRIIQLAEVRLVDSTLCRLGETYMIEAINRKNIENMGLVV